MIHSVIYTVFHVILTHLGGGVKFDWEGVKVPLPHPVGVHRGSYNYIYRPGQPNCPSFITVRVSFWLTRSVIGLRKCMGTLGARGSSGRMVSIIYRVWQVY